MATLLWQGLAQAQTVTRGEAATFRAKSSTAQSYEWTFPGGVVINGEIVQFTFTEPGPQEVKLRVVGFDGNTNEVSKRVLVANEGRPTAVIEAFVDNTEVLGRLVEADLSQSIKLNSNSFFADKGDDKFSKLWTINGRTYTSDTVGAVFDAVGNYQVVLTVEDLENSRFKDQDTVQVRIINQAPVITSLSVTQVASFPGQVQLSAQAEDADGRITSYKFEALEGGKTVLTQVVTSSEAILDLSRFAGEHEYQFRVTVTDDRFASDKFVAASTVKFNPNQTNNAPTAKLKVLPGNNAKVGERFTFSAEASDPDGDMLKYEWVLSTGQRFFTPQFETAFNRAGSYDITLNVTDGLEKVSDKLTVNIEDLEVLTIENQAPTAKINGVLPSKSGLTSTVFRLYLEAEDPNLDRLTYAWDFGNGTQSFTKNAAVIYQEPGSYTVKVAVSDGIETITDSVSLTVELGPSGESYESIEDRLVRLQEEAIEAERLALEAQGNLTEKQQALVDKIKEGPDGLDQMILDAESGNQTERLEARERLDAYHIDLGEAITTLEEAKALDETLPQALERLREEQKKAEDDAKALKEEGRQEAITRAADSRELLDTQAKNLEAKSDTLKTINLNKQGSLTSEQQALVDEIDADLVALIKEAQNGNIAAKIEAEKRLEAHQLGLETQAASLKTQADTLASTTLENQGTLTAEQQALITEIDADLATLIAEAQNGNAAARAESATRLETHLKSLEASISELEAARALDETVAEALVRLKTEQQETAAAAQALRAQGREEEAARIDAKQADLSAGIAQLEEAKALDETLEEAMARLAQEQATLKGASDQQRAAANADTAERLDARQANLADMVEQLEAAQANGETLEEAALRLQAQADLSKADSQAFNEAGEALESEALEERRDFLQTQIADLEAQRENPNLLPPLGISRQGRETLQERLDRLENQSDRAGFEAEERQRLAAQLAGAQQLEKIKELEALQDQLAAEQDAKKQVVLAARIAALETEVEDLELIRNPGESLSASEIQARTKLLTQEAEAQHKKVIAEQQAHIATRLAEIQNQIELETDIGKKAELEAEKKRLESNLNETNLVVDYQAQLESGRKDLNQRLAGDLNSTAELLVRTQLDSIEAKISSLEALSQANKAIKDFEVTSVQNPEALATTYLRKEQQRLQAELTQLRARMAGTSDAIALKAFRLRETELLEALARLPEAGGERSLIDDLSVVQSVDYLKHYRGAEARKKTSAQVSQNLNIIDGQLALLRRLDNSGYTPQTKLSALLLDLERREAELLADYRNAKDPRETQALKTKLVVLGEAKDQLSSLDRYGVAASDTVFVAAGKLESARARATEAYLGAATTTEQVIVTQALESLEKSTRWLGRFYNPERRETTIGDLELDLRQSATKTDKVQFVSDLEALQSVKSSLKKAIESQVSTDFENFKTNLKKQARQVNDETEKAAIEARIEALTYEDFAAGVSVENTEVFEALLADLTISTNTNLFLYADTPLSEHDQPLLFEWNMGDGETRFGQNVNHEYYEPGFYRVALTMSDGVTSQQDLFTIRVLNSVD